MSNFRLKGWDKAECRMTLCSIFLGVVVLGRGHRHTQRLCPDLDQCEGRIPCAAEEVGQASHFFFGWGVGVDVRERGTVGDRVVKIYRTWPIHRIMHKDENMPNIYNMS